MWIPNYTLSWTRSAGRTRDGNANYENRESNQPSREDGISLRPSFAQGTVPRTRCWGLGGRNALPKTRI